MKHVLPGRPITKMYTFNSGLFSGKKQHFHLSPLESTLLYYSVTFVRYNAFPQTFIVGYCKCIMICKFNSFQFHYLSSLSILLCKLTKVAPSCNRGVKHPPLFGHRGLMFTFKSVRNSAVSLAGGVLQHRS